jgi:hypothetical protein
MHVVFLDGSELMQVLLSFVYICVGVGVPIIKRRELG